MSEKKYEFLYDDPNAKIRPIMVSLIIGAFFAILNETLLNIALTTLMDEFGLTAPTVQWMATGFMLVMGILTPISAVLIQWFTTRQMFIGTMLTFMLGTIVCAVAPTFPILLTGRFIQAAGTGLLIPIIFNAMLLIYPPKKRGAVMGTVGLVIMFAPAIGPTLSGIIVEHFGWRYLFIFVIPFTLFSILFGYKYLQNVGEVTKPKVDILSIVLSTIGFGGIVYAFSSVGESGAGYLNPEVLIMIAIAVIALIVFSFRQTKLDDPLLDLRAFKHPMFTFGIIMFIIVMMGMFSSEIILPMFMQSALGIGAATAGLVLLPGSLLSGLLSPVTGKLFDKFGPRKLLIPGTLILCIVLFMLSQVSLNTQAWQLALFYIMIMLSISMIMMPAQTNGLNELSKNMYPHGTAIFNTLQPVFGAVGVSVFVSIMTARKQNFLEQTSQTINAHTKKLAMVSGVETVYMIAFGFAVLAFIVALFIKRGEPADVGESANG